MFYAGLVTTKYIERGCAISREAYLRDHDITLYQGDVIDVLSDMPDESVDCVVTSPPYW